MRVQVEHVLSNMGVRVALLIYTIGCHSQHYLVLVLVRDVLEILLSTCCSISFMLY